MVVIDMEMPESCRQCEFEKNGECFILTVWMRRQELAAVDGMRDDCPLLDVTEEAVTAICEMMSERNCDDCVWATRSGFCRSWECRYIPIKEAAAAWQAAQEWLKAEKEKDGKEE